MEKSLFRKKSMERISSPEELHDYMRVTSPRLWMILGAIVALLAGFIVYASTATMENTMTIQVQISQYGLQENGTGEREYITGIQAYLPGSMKDQVQTGMMVRIGKEETTVNYIGVREDGMIFLTIDPIEDYLPLPEGVYDAELVLESTTPISFLWN
ncbi:MAG: hypothetical protein IKQ41_11075 [Clostridia bacterium]|nr:hypothetical protein [Clostridia bacterium]